MGTLKYKDPITGEWQKVGLCMSNNEVDIPEWAQQEEKPTYTAEEVGAMAAVEITSEDEGKFLRVIDGKWAATKIENAEGAKF